MELFESIRMKLGRPIYTLFIQELESRLGEKYSAEMSLEEFEEIHIRISYQISTSLKLRISYNTIVALNYSEQILEGVRGNASAVNILDVIKYLLPPRYREEFVGDMAEIKFELETAKCKKITIWFILGFNLLSIMWHAFRFKLGEYF